MPVPFGMTPFAAWWVALLAGVLIGAVLVWLTMRGRAGEQATRAAQMRDAFAAVSQDALRSNQQSFLDLASLRFGELQAQSRGDVEARQKSVDDLVAPIRERMDQVLETIARVDMSRAESHAALREQLASVAESQLRLRDETGNLVKALRAPQVRGRWGEMQLRRVVEMAGMLANCDFAEQRSVDTIDGRLRPDLIVHLPGDKLIVVDAKAPLDAYLSAIEAGDDDSRDALLDRHARQVRDHIDMLSARDYAVQFTESPDFVVLFLPGETFFSEACRRDPTLIEYAVARSVIPASPTTLITLLKAVAFGWQQERIARDAEQLRDLGIDLHDRIGKAAEHIAGVGRGLNTAVQAFNHAVGSLESRVLPAARRFHDLGAGGRQQIVPLAPVDLVARELTAPELAPPLEPE